MSTIPAKIRIGLCLLVICSYSAGSLATCPKGEIPRPVAYPEALGILPLDIPQASEAMPEALSGRLNLAASQFADRSPAWSLAVAGPRLGVWTKTLGTNDNARFAAASIGKSMTAVLVFQLIEQGKLALTDPVATWFPELPEAESVTIEHLLTHRSGYFIEATGPLSGPYRPPQGEIDQLKDQAVLFCAGQGWAYSNVGYQLLGLILEAITGMDYRSLLKQNIIEPLALTQTHVIVPEEKDALMVAGHQGGHQVDFVDYASAYAAGPVSTTAADLVRYWQALLTGQLINASSLQAMVSPAWPMFGNSQMAYGSGIQVANVPDGPGAMLMHSGGITGFSATVAWLAEDQVFVAVLANERTVPAEAALWALVRSLQGDHLN